MILASKKNNKIPKTPSYNVRNRINHSVNNKRNRNEENLYQNKEDYYYDQDYYKYNDYENWNNTNDYNATDYYYGYNYDYNNYDYDYDYYYYNDNNSINKLSLQPKYGTKYLSYTKYKEDNKEKNKNNYNTNNDNFGISRSLYRSSDKYFNEYNSDDT